MTPNLDMATGPARILIVDDEHYNTQLLEVMLMHEGFLLLAASSGEEALALVARESVDLVLLDMMMPGMDGCQVATQLKSNPATRNIPIIMITALDDRNARMLALSAGAEEFLSKPVDRAELSVRVRNLLRLKAYGDYHDKYGQMLEVEVGSRTSDLVESERLYRSTFEAAPVGIGHVGVDGSWLRVNPRLCQIFGYSRGELQSTSARHLTSSDVEIEGQVDWFQQLVAGPSTQPLVDERRCRRRDGSLLWIRANVSVHRDTEGTPLRFILVIEDISERRTLEMQVQQSNKMDAIGGLAAGIAHDFNNLLSVVLTYSELLAEELKAGDPMRDGLDEIKRAGNRAKDLTRQLLAFSRQQVLERKIVDLSEILGSMEVMLRRVLGEDVELTAICTSGLGKILVDPGQIEQVIMNLAVNARDAMPGGGKLTIETMAVELDEGYASEHIDVKPGSHIVLAVTDTGVGMNSATQARIFEPFFTTKEVGKGTGLGLATVFGIVRQSGGTIWVYSEVGRGTTFKVYLPVTEGAVVVQAPPLVLESHALRGSETILLVEDEERVRALACTILRKYGYNVLESQSGGDAFLLCEQHDATIHLLLTDVVMPRMSGRQLAERVRTLRPDMKVLYMSGYTDEAVMRHGILDSTVAFMQKPITPEALARKVREVLGPAASSGLASRALS